MSTRLRARRLLLRQGRTVALLLVAAGLLLVLAGGYVYATPGTETVTERVDVQSVSTSVEPSAVVTGNTTLYEPGERLVDPSAYLFRATPVVDIDVRTSLPAGPTVAVDQRLVLELSALNGGEAFWEERRLLGADREDVTDGSAALSTSVDVLALHERMEAAREELGSVGVVQARLNLTVAYDTGTHRGTLAVTAPIVVTDTAYWFDGPLADSREHARTVTRTVEAEPDLGLVATLVLLGLGSLVGAVAAVRFGGVEADEPSLETELAHSRYDEWISSGEFPTRTDKRFVHINTLEDLVDVAIDSNKRVVHDEDVEAYSVVDGDLVYYYTPHRGDIDSWLDV